MENHKKDKKDEEQSPYQELYGNKDGENTSTAKEDDAGSFGSATNPPGPESSSANDDDKKDQAIPKEGDTRGSA